MKRQSKAAEPIHCTLVRRLFGWYRNEPPNVRVYLSVYLICSYAYYHLDSATPLSDEEYDQVCAYLLEHLEEAWATCRDDETDLLDADLLRAGTGFSLKRSHYPEQIRRQAEWLQHVVDYP